MSLTPGGPFEVRDRDGVLQCFDATAAALYPWICRLIGGEHAAGAVLAAVYLRLEEQVSAAGPATIDVVRLEALAFALAAAEDNSASPGSSSAPAHVTERALVELAIEQHREPAEIAAIVGISLAELDGRVASVRSRISGLGAGRSAASGAGWLDDVTRSAARDAIERSRVTAPPVRSQAASDTNAQPRPTAQNHSRRMWVIALASVTTVLAAGFWWSSSPGTGRSSSPDGTPLELGTPDTKPTTTTGPTDPLSAVRTDTASANTIAIANTSEPSTSVPYAGRALRLSPGFSIDVPEGMQPIGLSESPADENLQDPTIADQWFQLWAEPEASRISGRWLAIDTVADENNVGSLRTGWTRLAGAGYAGLRLTHPDGVIDLDLKISRPAGDIGVSITSFGISDVDLVRVAASLVHFDSPIPAPNARLLPALLEPSLSVSDVMRGMELIGTGPTSCCGIKGPSRAPVDSRTVTYSSIDDPHHGPWLSIQTSDGIIASPFERFLTERSGDPSAPQNATSTVAVGDRIVHVNGATSFDGASTTMSNIVWWVQDGRTISLSGSVSLGQLLALVSTAHRATENEWLQLNERIALQPTVVYDDPLAGPTTQIGSVHLDDASTWSFTLGAGARVGQLMTSGGALGEQAFGGPVSPSDGHDVVIEYDNISATGVIVMLHDPVPARALVRVTVAGRPPSLVPLVHVDGTDVWSAFDAFAQLPPYTVELVDTTGVVLRTLEH